MCQSAANGGQRCYTHGRRRLTRAKARLDAAARNARDSSAVASNADVPEVDLAHDAWVEALTDLASTPRGKRDVARLAQVGGISADLAHAVARDGQWRRQRNRLVGDVRRLGAVAAVPKAGDPRLDLLLHDAAQSVAATPTRHGIALDDWTFVGLSNPPSHSPHAKKAAVRRTATVVEDHVMRLGDLTRAARDIERHPDLMAPGSESFRADQVARAYRTVDSCAGALAFWRTQLLRAALTVPD